MANNNQKAFFALVRAGLFPVHGEGFLDEPSGRAERMVHDYSNVDWGEVYRLAEEQSVIGLVAAGIETVQGSWLKVHGSSLVPQEWALQFIGQTLQIEQQNKAMNAFINELIGNLRKAGIYTLIVKGQGVAQCYEKPLWRASGDIDLYLNEDDFQKAKIFFRPLVDKFDPDNDHTRHINMHYGEWVVEIHANQNCSLSPRINRVMQEVHDDIFYHGNVRSWMNNGTQIFLPSADNDAMIIFTHFLNHFYRGGVGMRQVCDWCRLLYTYRESLNYGLLESRIRKAGLMSEWRAFGAYAVSYLGMPKEAMPLFNVNDDLNANLKRKADRISRFILEVGNFGHNRDTSYYGKYPFLVRKAISLSRRLQDLVRHARIFPMDSVRFLFGMTISSLKAVSHGE